MSNDNFRLYTLTNDYQRALDNAIEGEEPKELEDIKDSFEKKCIAVAKYIKNKEAECNAIEEAAHAMAERAKKAANRISSLTEYLRFNIEKSGLADPISCPEFEIKICKNPSSLIIFDSALIPDMYKIIEEHIMINKALLKYDIKNGFEVEGACLESKTRLVIK